jgi:hypothetical protein
MTPAQDGLLGQLTDVLGQDPRILGLWLTGSFGRGEGDRWSDIDLWAEVAAADQGPCVADYLKPRPGMPETVHVMLVSGVIVSAVTSAWERYDITFLTRPQMAGLDTGKARLLTGTPLPPPAPRLPDTGAAARVEALVREFLRVAGLAPGGAARQEWLVMQQGIELLRNMTITLMLEENAVPPTARGAKALNAFLTPEQRAALEAVVPPAADRAALLAGTVELGRLFLPRARALCDRLGAAWPQAFEDATRAHLKETLSLDI